jgi:hypothetical protein
VIEVNINCPEANRELTVFQLDNIPGVIKAEERYHGYSIQILVDIRWTLDDDTIDHYTGRVWKEDALLFRLPAFPYTILHNREEMSSAGWIPDNVINSMDNARHEFENNKVLREWKYFLLQFPPGHVLSSKAVYDEAGDNEELDYDIVDVTYTHAKVTGINTEHWMHFKVARTDLRVSKRGKVEKKEKKSKMAAKLEAKARKAKEAEAGMKDEGD